MAKSTQVIILPKWREELLKKLSEAKDSGRLLVFCGGQRFGLSTLMRIYSAQDVTPNKEHPDDQG